MSESKAKVWFPFYIGDYLSDTQHLTPSEHGAYLLLLCHQWRSGHMTLAHMRQISRLDADAWSMSQATLLHFFSKDEAGGYYQARLERERANWAEKQKKAQEKAAKAANARWAKRDRKTGEQVKKPMLGASPKQSAGSATDPAQGMPFTFTGSNTSPSQAQGKAPGDGGPVDRVDNGLRDAEKPEATQSPIVASGENEHSELGIPSEHPLVRLSEARKPTTGDTRFHPFKGVLRSWWGQLSGKPAKECPWGGRDDKALKDVLVAEPHLSIEDLRDRLARRWAAVEATSTWPNSRRGKVSAAAPMWDVLAKLVRYSEHPVDDFGERL